jgi:ATP-dependent Clp protease protease subunit
MKSKTNNQSPTSNVFRTGRTIYFFDEVNETSAVKSVNLINEIQTEGIVKPIVFIINSPGGSCYDGLSIYDTMRACRAPITTIGMGMVASMGFIIYLAGDKRVTTPSTRFLNHQLSAYNYGRYSDLVIEHEEHVKLMATLRDIVVDRTKLTKEEVIKTTDKGDAYYTAEEAVKSGIAHEIVYYVKKVIKK